MKDMYGIEMHEDGSIDTTKLLDNVLEINRKEEAASEQIVTEEPNITDEEWEEQSGCAELEQDKSEEESSSEIFKELQKYTAEQAELSTLTTPCVNRINMNFDEVTMSTFDSKLLVEIKAERAIVSGTGNVAYKLKVTDLVTGAVATGTLAECSKMIKELLSCGNTTLANRFGAMEFQDACIFEIEHVMQYSKLNLRHTHSIVGWTNPAEDNAQYCGNSIVDGQSMTIIQSQYRGKAIKMVQAGNLQSWIDAVKTYAKDKPILDCVLASSLSGIIRQRYEKLSRDTNIIIGLVGGTSCGKTTAIRMATTAHTTGEAITTSNGTIAALTKRFAARPTIPATIDEAKLMNGVRQGKESEAFRLLMTLASGESRDRLSKDGSQQDEEKYYAPVLLTSTKSLLFASGSDEGQAQRILEFKVSSGDLTDSDEQARIAEQAFEDNCGWFAEAFALRLLLNETMHNGKASYEQYLLKEFNNIRTELASKMLMPRMANRGAMIILCAQLMNSMVDNVFDIEAMKDVIVSRCNYIRKQFVDCPIELDAQEAKGKFAEYFIKNRKYFLTSRPSTREELEQSLGLIVKDGVNTDVQFYDYEILSKVLYEVPAEVILGFEEGTECIRIGNIENVLKWWNDHCGILKKSDHKYQKKATMVKGEKQEYIYEVILTPQTLNEARTNLEA